MSMLVAEYEPGAGATTNRALRTQPEERRAYPEPTWIAAEVAQSMRQPMTLSSPETNSLLARIAAGDSEAVRACLDKYSPLVWTLVRKAWRDFSTLEDLVQEIFIEIWRSASRFDPRRASEATFIATIARRRVIDRLRRAGSRAEVELDESEQIPKEDNALELVDLGDDAKQAHQALQELNSDQRRVILLSVLDGHTHLEIAGITGIPLGTVKSHIRRGLSQVAEDLRTRKSGTKSSKQGRDSR